MSLDSSLIKQCYKFQFYTLDRLLIKVGRLHNMLFQMSGIDRPYNLSEQKLLEQSRNISVGYTNLIHLIQMRSYKSLNDIPSIHVTITITNKWNRTVDAFCVSNAILGQMINGWLKINQFRNNLKRFSLSGLHRIDIIIYLIKSTTYKSVNDDR